MKKILNIITFASFVIFLLNGLYGYSGNPVDPPKPGSTAATVTLPAASPTNECSDLMSLVPVTVYVTFTDCPDRDCCYPKDCSFNICIYDNVGNELGCKPWDPETCQYVFTGIRAEENTNIGAKLVLLTSCICNFNEDQAFGMVPQGGGDVPINTTYCP